MATDPPEPDEFHPWRAACAQDVETSQVLQKKAAERNSAKQITARLFSGRARGPWGVTKPIP